MRAPWTFPFLKTEQNQFFLVGQTGQMERDLSVLYDAGFYPLQRHLPDKLFSYIF